MVREERNVREQPEQKRRVVCDSLYLWSNMWSKIFGLSVLGGCGGSKPLLERKIEKSAKIGRFSRIFGLSDWT